MYGKLSIYYLDIVSFFYLFLSIFHIYPVEIIFYNIQQKFIIKRIFTILIKNTTAKLL